MDKVTCTEILIVEFCTSPESEMKEVGNRTEGVEVLTITEADDGTRSDTIESVREQMVRHRKKRKLIVLWSSIPCTGGCPFQYICIFFPRVRTPCGHGAQVIVEGREEKTDGGERNEDPKNQPKTKHPSPQADSTIL